MSIEKELQELSGVKQNRREEVQSYLERIVKALNDVSDSKYNKLSKAAQDWAEEATEAYNNKDEIPLFPEEDSADDDEAETDAGSEDDTAKDAGDDGEPEEDQPEDDDMPATRTDDENEAPRKRDGKVPVRKVASKAESKKDGGNKTGTTAKAGGGLTYVRELLVKDPDITVPALAEKVKVKGFAVSTQTLHTTRSGFRQDLRVLQEAGLLKRKLV
jgi:hypothetical protein